MAKGCKPDPADVIGTPPSRKIIFTATLGLLLIVVGTLIPLFFGAGQNYVDLPQYYKYIYGGGAVILIIARVMNKYTGCDLRVRRLYRIEAWSAIFFCVAAFFLFYEPYNSRNWLAFTMAGGVLQLITSIMIPRAIRKALKDN